MQSPVVRLLPLALLAACLAGCGGSTPKHASKFGIFVENLPKHRVFQLNWTESARDLSGHPLMTFRIKTLEVGPDGWKTQVSFRNVSAKTILLPTGGPRSPQSWGLGVFTNVTSQRVEDQGNYEIKPKTIAPGLPAELKPGQSWSGTFAAPEPPRAERWLHVVFGVFFWKGKPPSGLGPYFLWITTHQLRAPPPQGILPAASTTSP